jgi:hypothetical protein
MRTSQNPADKPRQVMIKSHQTSCRWPDTLAAGFNFSLRPMLIAEWRKPLVNDGTMALVGVAVVRSRERTRRKDDMEATSNHSLADCFL